MALIRWLVRMLPAPIPQAMGHSSGDEHHQKADGVRAPNIGDLDQRGLPEQGGPSRAIEKPVSA
jgi:hypothetical protein